MCTSSLSIINNNNDNNNNNNNDNYDYYPILPSITPGVRAVPVWPHVYISVQRNSDEL
jgi:hypothetical protein